MKNVINMTARDLIARLVDEGSFVEVDKYVRRSNAVYGYEDVSAPGEGVISGWGKIGGVPVCAFAQDASVLDGSLGTAHANKIVKALEMAKKSGYPVICIWCSSGARIQEGACAADAYIKVAKALNDLSGVVPTISIVAGEMFGISSAFAAMTDFTIAIDGVSACAVHPPMVIASKYGKDADAQKIAGAKVMAEENGIAQLICANAEEAIEAAKRLLLYLPSNNLDSADIEITADDINRSVFADASDSRALIADFVDQGSLFEIGKDFAPEIITSFAMMGGISCGVIANAGKEEMTENAYRKAARFLSILNAFDLPAITVINSAGTKVDIDAVKHSQTASYSKLIAVYALAGCPKIALITGDAIGEGWAAMGASSCHDLVYALDGAKIGCMTKEAGSIALYGSPGKEEEYESAFLAPNIAAEQGVVDDVIDTEMTRRVLVNAIETAINKREEKPLRKHIIMPL